MKHLSIRSKILLSVAPLLLVVVALLFIMVSSLARQRTLYDSALLWEEHAARVLEVRGWTRDCLLHTYLYATDGSDTSRRDALDARDRAVNVMKASSALAAKFSAEEVEEEREVQEAFGEVTALVARVIEKRQAGDEEGARDVYLEELLGEAGVELDKAMDARVTEEQVGARKFHNLADEEAEKATRLAVALAALLSLLGAGAAFHVLAGMVRQIRELRAGTLRIGQGDLATPIPVLTQDDLGELAASFTGMARELDTSRQQLAAAERLKSELSLARRIQTLLLPAQPRVEGLEVGARMLPATEVGGDYYEVLNMEDGAWLAIGDVSGHGVTAGLEMLMLQCAVSTCVQQAPAIQPAELLAAVNRVLWDNIHVRLARDDFATLCLLRYRRDGSLHIAGAHLPVLIHRQATGRCEALQVEGAWMASASDISGFFQEQHTRLEPGDVMVLCTDGVTEAANAAGELFGQPRLEAAIQRHAALPAERMVEAIVADVTAWMAQQADDITLMVVRHTGRG